MGTELYLDTARLGRMCPEARRAEQHFAKLVSQLGSSLYFDRFLRDGYRELPYSLRRHVPYLRSWHGVAGLKQRIRDLTGLPPLPVLLASRSTVWMHVAAKCLFAKCHSVLTTDLEWPPYLAILKRTARATNGQLTVCRLRCMHPHLTKQTIVDVIGKTCHKNACDGLFLSSVSYQGIRVPVNDVIRRCSLLARPNFIVIDGAQALGHAPLDLSTAEYDLLLTGSQKWLRGNLPLGMAICCREKTTRFITDTATKGRTVQDPLFLFTQELESSRYTRFGETAIVTPLFTTNAALIRTLVQAKNESAGWAARLQNRRNLLELLPRSWTLQSPNGSLASGAIVLQSNSPSLRTAAPGLIRSAFLVGGVTITAYKHGNVRLSLPSRTIRTSRLERLLDVLATLS